MISSPLTNKSFQHKLCFYQPKQCFYQWDLQKWGGDVTNTPTPHASSEGASSFSVFLLVFAHSIAD